jgi:hypothetical protein
MSEEAVDAENRVSRLVMDVLSGGVSAVLGVLGGFEVI